MKIQLLIDPEGSNFSYEQLKSIFVQNVFMIEMVSGFEFSPIRTSYQPAHADADKTVVIKFLPKSEFGSPFHMAGIRPSGIPGVTWIAFNINMIGMLTLPFLRALGLHELGHVLGMRHTEGQYSVMSIYELRQMIDKSLFWRQDLNYLWALGPETLPPTGHIFADEHMRIMVPAIEYHGTQWAFVLQYLSGNVFGIKHAYDPDDDMELPVKATFANDILELHDVTTVDGIVYPLARFKMKTENTLELLP